MTDTDLDRAKHDSPARFAAASAPVEVASARDRQGPEHLEATKVTLYALGTFGTRKLEATHVKIWTGKYAQYSAAVFVEYVPKRARKPRQFVETFEPRLIVLDGFGHPEEPDRLDRDEHGNARTRWTSCAPEWAHHFDRDFAPYLQRLGSRVLADYRRHNPHGSPRQRATAAGPFTAGDRVHTPQGPGVVVYRRMAPPDFLHPEAYSVRLDGRDHVGAMFAAADVAAEGVQS